jgi:hypothetical protein
LPALASIADAPPLDDPVELPLLEWLPRDRAICAFLKLKHLEWTLGLPPVGVNVQAASPLAVAMRQAQMNWPALGSDVPPKTPVKAMVHGEFTDHVTPVFVDNSHRNATSRLPSTMLVGRAGVAVTPSLPELTSEGTMLVMDY